MKNSRVKTLQEVKSKLESKYAKISDFKVSGYLESGVSIGAGFYQMDGTNNTKFPFHEINYRFDISESCLGKVLTTTDEIFNYIDSGIQDKLKWQKKSDEDYAAELGTPVRYKFDYSVIDEN